MTDELLLRRLRIGWHDDDTPIWVSDAMTEAADRIKQLTAERDKYESAWMTAEGKLADAEVLIEAQAKDHASNNIRFAEAEHRAKTAEAERDEAWAYMSAAQGDLYDAIMIEAERDRLREALIELIQQTHNCERELTEDLHHVDFCGESVPLTNAREALKGGGHE